MLSPLTLFEKPQQHLYNVFTISHLSQYLQRYIYLCFYNLKLRQSLLTCSFCPLKSFFIYLYNDNKENCAELSDHYDHGPLENYKKKVCEEFRCDFLQ